MKTLVFAVAGYNLAETGRMIEIARAAKDYFNVIFMSYGGQFEDLIEKEKFQLVKMEPRLTEKKLDRLRLVLSGETLNTVGYLSAKELEPRVENEIKLFNPDLELPGDGDEIVVRKGMTLERKEFERMKDEYYLLRGWGVDTGLQKKEKLEELGLSFTCSEMDNLGLLKKE
jgi:hypothetical protein